MLPCKSMCRTYLLQHGTSSFSLGCTALAVQALQMLWAAWEVGADHVSNADKRLDRIWTVPGGKMSACAHAAEAHLAVANMVTGMRACTGHCVRHSGATHQQGRYQPSRGMQVPAK